MKKLLLSIIVLHIILLLTGCKIYSTPEEEVSDVLNIDVSNGTLITSNDTHEGPHGDGQTYISISFDDDKTAKEIAQNNLWKPFPLSENVTAIVYGSQTSVGEWEPFFSDTDEPIFPTIENGYYYFLDKQAEKENMHDDTHIFDDDRYSFNFVVALYDTDTNILYFARYDT